MPECPDASALIAYAEAHGLEWEWKVESEGDRWRGYAAIGMIRTNGLNESPQAALDSCTAFLIRCREEQPRPSYSGLPG